MIKQIAAATAAMLVAGAACAQDMTSLQDYSCNDGSDLSVAYINAEGGSALAVLLIEGRKMNAVTCAFRCRPDRRSRRSGCRIPPI